MAERAYLWPASDCQSYQKGEYLEDYVAASLQCGGFYVEKSLIERGESSVLELDAVAWKANEQVPQTTLIEVKGGNWGFPDVFKVHGWHKYLEKRNISSAYLIGPVDGRSKEVVEYMHNKCEEIGLGLVMYNDLEDLESNLVSEGLSRNVQGRTDHSLWRFSFWLERKMQKVVRDNRKEHGDLRGASEVYKYQELIRNGLLQARDIRERLASLYGAHFRHRALAKAVAAELEGNGWNPDDPHSDRYWKEALYESKHDIVQAAMYYEHRAKLGVLKGAVEYALLKKRDALPPQEKVRFLDVEFPADFLPDSFHRTVDRLQNVEQFDKIPFLWQTLLWKWGGFFVTDHEDDEKSALAEEAGANPSIIDEMIGIYDTLFPVNGGWWSEFEGTKILNLFPGSFRGIGVNFRMKREGSRNIQDVFGDLPYTYLTTNLSKWNNSSVKLLKYGEPK